MSKPPPTNPIPEGWRVPTERELAQQTTLTLRKELRLFRDGWRRYWRDQWHPCDSFGKREKKIEVLRDGKTLIIGTREPVDELGQTSMKPYDETDETQGREVRVEYDAGHTEEPEDYE